jgi:formylglycine-generating enzyme required for sulfatase activity
MTDPLLEQLGFVHLLGGPVQLGSTQPLACRMEGHRLNETPVRQFEVGPFWIAKYCVTNQEFERFVPAHRRPAVGAQDRHPVTEVTYVDATTYAAWLSEKLGRPFSLPTEEQWVFAAAPYGFEYPWGNRHSLGKAHVFNPDFEGPLLVDDERFGVNYCGLFHIGGNIQEFMLGATYAAGTHGAAADGMYCIIKGGDWSHCPRSPAVQRRGIIDIGVRAPTIGFRLVVST